MKLCKRFSALILSACLCAALAVPQRAGAVNDPAVGITITPDQTSYAQGEQVKFDVKVINHNDYDLSDLKLNASVSETLEITENEAYQMQIGAFETKNYTISAKAATPAEQPGTTEIQTPDGDKTVTAPKTGDDGSGMLTVMLILGLLAVGLLAAKKHRETKAMLSLLLCTAMLGIMCPRDFLRAEAARTSLTSDSVTFQYGGSQERISIAVSYTESDTIIHPDLSRFDMIQQHSTYEADTPFSGLTGTLDSSDQVVKFTYENHDAWDTLLCRGEIQVGEAWSIRDMGLIQGVNVITLMAELSDGTTATKTIRFNNSSQENEKNLLVDLSDADGDTMNAYVEDLYGTDPENADTDGDGIADNVELFIYGTDPLKPDTDGDGLSDGAEVGEYRSNPLVRDTDGDGISDGEAVAQGIDPTGIKENPVVRTQSVQTALESTEKPLFDNVSVTMNVGGNLNQHLSIRNIEKEDTLSANVVGALSAPIEITSDASFTSAKITFTYDEALLGDTPAENLAVMWYDRENRRYVILDKDTVVDTNAHTVSYTTTHFSTYLVVDREVWYDCWRENIDYRSGDAGTSQLEPYDIGLCVDVSGSMYGDRLAKAKTALNTFIDAMLPQDKACMVSFSDNAYLVAGYGASKEVMRSRINQLRDLYGTNTDVCLSKTISILADQGRSDASKMIIMICDGDVNYIQGTVDAAKAAGIAVYTINVVSGDNDLLQKIADETGGEYYYAATTEEVVSQVEAIRGETVSAVDTTDADGDGLYDVYESRGMKIQNGTVWYSDPLNPDSDGDGVTDYQELMGPPTANVMEFVNGKYSCVLCRAASDPNKMDSDGDGIPDAKDPDPTVHFGLIDGSVQFQLTDSIDDFQMPQYIQDIKENEADYEHEVVSKRYPWMIEHPLKGFAYLQTLRARAAATWEAGYVGDLVFLTWDLGCKALSLIPGVHFVGNRNINNAAYMLLYYNSNIGGTMVFDATDMVTATTGGQTCYNKNIGKLKTAFEQALKPGETRIITTTPDSSFTAWYLDGGILDPNNADAWASLNKCNAVMTATCTYDGTKYRATVNYYVVDRYDFYEPDPVDGEENEVGFVTNDGYVILSYFDYAEPFDVVGYYTETFEWNGN
ncbi:vWA domain-containing protein [Ruminococcus champanellensis]|uniref:vWA domain-containing protein n=1 Tax=Ruminococcus champanellensis TaxID=1161942 RepID=UPI0026DC37C4|nr:VWA domain-containing protein [Ruminococcus champanellensis]